MPGMTIGLYVTAFGLWGLCVHRERSIGIGIRFMYALNLVLFFLLGPVIEELTSPTHSRFASATYESTINLCLCAFMAYVVSSYLVIPMLAGTPVLIPAQLSSEMANPARVNAQWKLAKTLIVIGFASLPLFATVRFIPTLGAVFGQMPWLIDTGLMMLCMIFAYTRRPGVLPTVLAIILVKGAVFSAMSGHAGWIFLNGMVLTSIAFLSRRVRLASLATLLLLGAIAFIPAQMWMFGRQRLRDAIEKGVSLDERIAITFDIFTNVQGWTESNHESMSTYRSRGDFSDLMAAALAHTPSIQPYAGGASYLDVFYAIIPRFIWPDKPIVAGGNEFVSKYTGITFGKTTSVGMHHMFELYVNFGPWGAVIGMFLLGMFVSWMELLYYRKGVANLAYEACIVMCSWTVCIYSDKMSGLAMTVIPSVVMSLSICTALRFRIHSRYLPNVFWGQSSQLPPPRKRPSVDPANPLASSKSPL